MLSAACGAFGLTNAEVVATERSSARVATDARGSFGEESVEMTGRYLEDFAVGQIFRSGPLPVDKARIKTFAAEFDA